jgi:hypothetical protein
MRICWTQQAAPPRRSPITPAFRGYNDAVLPALTDTDPETQRVHSDLLRRASPARRLRLALSLSQTVIALSRAGLARRNPDSASEEVGLRFVALHYGEDLATAVRRQIEARRP